MTKKKIIENLSNNKSKSEKGKELFVLTYFFLIPKFICFFNISILGEKRGKKQFYHDKKFSLLKIAFIILNIKNFY